MPQEHLRSRSSTNGQFSITNSAIQAAQPSFVSKWSSISAFEVVPKVHIQVHNLVGVAATDPSFDASRSPLDLPRHKGHDRLDKTDSCLESGGSNIVGSNMAGSKQTSLTRDLFREIPSTRRSGHTKAPIGSITQKDSVLNPSPDRHNKQKTSADEHEHDEPPSESTKRLKRHQIDRPGSPGRETHPDLEQPPRERCIANRHAKANLCPARNPLDRPITTEIRTLPGPWSTSCSQDYPGPFKNRGELQDAILGDRHQPAMNGSNYGSPNGIRKFQPSYGYRNRHVAGVNDANPNISSTGIRACMPPLVDTDRHHTRLTVGNNGFDSHTRCHTKHDLQIRATAVHRHGGGYLDPVKPESGGDAGSTGDEDDDDEHIGFRKVNESPKHPRSSSHAGHSSRTRTLEYSKTNDPPNPRGWQSRRCGSYPGVS